MFNPLSRKDIRKITEIQLESLKETLAKQDVKIEFSTQAKDWLADKGYHPEFGARPLKRVIQKQVLNRLSDELLLGKIQPKDHIVMDVFDNMVVFRQPREAEIEM